MNRQIRSAIGDNTRLVDYDYYAQVYCGKSVTSRNDFDRLNKKAELAVSFYTLNKVSKFKEGTSEYDALLYTICEVIDHYSMVEKVGIKNSESFADRSVSYNIDMLDSKREVLNIIRRNLTHTGALYRGV